MQQYAILALAVVMAAFATPLFLDLAVCIVGNLRRAHGPRATVRRTIRLAVIVPAHDEEPMIARTVASLKAADSVDARFLLWRTTARMRRPQWRQRPAHRLRN